MVSWNPFDWVDEGLDQVGEAWDTVTETFTDFVKGAGSKVTQVTPGGKVAIQTAGAGAEKVQEVTRPVYGQIKGFSRAATSALDFPLQVLNNYSAFAYNNPILANTVMPLNPQAGFGRPKGFKEAKASTLEQLVGIVRNTTVSEMIADALPGGEKLNAGTGFFPGGELVKEVNDRKKELYPTLYGSTYTTGRAFAAALADSGVIEPGSVGYNAISGAIDFVWTGYADPVNWIPAGTALQIGDVRIPLAAAARTGKRAKVSTTLTPKARRVIDKAVEEGRVILNDVGLIDNGRRVVNPNNWEAFKVTKRGANFFENFVGDAARSPAEIWRRSNGQIPFGTAVKLAAAETVDEVVAALDDAVYSGDPTQHVRILPGVDPRPIVTKVGATIKGNVSRYRPFADTLPESTDFPLNNPQKAVLNVEGVMAVLEVPIKKRNQLLDGLLEALTGTGEKPVFDWLDKFEKEIVAEQLRKWNYSEDEIRRIASWRKRYEETVSSFVTDNAGSSVPLPWLVGGPNGGYGPLLLSQLLKVNPTLIDPTDLRDFADRLGPLRSRLEASRRRVIETLTDPDTGRVLVTETEPRSWVDTPTAVVEATGDLVDFMQSRVWKTNILLRPRYLIRTLPDEMTRVAMSGVFDHPFQYIAQIFTNRMSKDIYGNIVTTARQAAKVEARLMETNRLITRVRQLAADGATTYKGKDIQYILDTLLPVVDDLTKQLDDFDERIGRMVPGIDDALLSSAPQKAANLILNPSAVSSSVKSGHLVSVERAVNPRLWAKAMAERLAERSANKYYREIAKDLLAGKTVDEITERFVSGDLVDVLDDYRKGVGNLNPDYVWDFQGVKNFVQTNIDDMNVYTFNGDQTLMEALAKGNFEGEELFSLKGFQALSRRAPQGVKQYESNVALRKYIKDMYSKDPNAPARVNYFPTVFDTDPSMRSVARRVSERYDALLNLFWDGMYGVSSDTLARNPLWSQAKWQRIIELVPLMDPDEAAKLVDSVNDMDLFPTIKEDIVELAGKAVGEMTMDDVEELAELFATKFTRDNLFDASRRTVFGAAHRKMFPFYDAFVELTGSALKLATNPKFVHRVDKVLGEARQNTFFGSDLDGDGQKESFLYRDPVSGDEMFAFNASGPWVKKWTDTGLDFKVANTLSGLSMISTPYPSLSPFVALPLTKLLPDTAEWNKVKDLIAPYGVPDLSDPSIAQFLVPGATEQVQRILGAAGVSLFSDVEDRQKVMQSTIRALQVIASAKDYDPVTPGIQGATGYENLQDFENQAKELGLKMWGLTGWAGLFLPGAPIVQWSAKTNQGNVLISLLSQRWNQIDKKGDELGLDYQDKLEQFVTEFGNENLLAFLQPITERSITGSNSSREWYDWYSKNKKVVDTYPDVGGYFAPESGELDPDVWNIQKIAGDVGYKDPEEFAKNLESAMANFIYNRNLRIFEDSIPPGERESKKAKAALKEEKARLADGLKRAYPNWDRATAATQATRERELKFYQIRKFIEEPSQQDNPVVKATKEYLAFRDENLQYVMANAPKINEENWKTMTANRAAIALRGALWEEGERLAEQHPEFVNLWQNVLSREFISVETEE